MQQNSNKRVLQSGVKTALLNDVSLAAKVINILGGEISLPSFTQMVYRDSQKLTKTKVINTIAVSMKISAEDVLVETCTK